VKEIPPTDSWHQVGSDWCNLHPLMPALTLVSLLETYLVLETAVPRGYIRKRPSAHLYASFDTASFSETIVQSFHEFQS
jgi:hypothetical protein